jgi:hypothetical protein
MGDPVFIIHQGLASYNTRLMRSEIAKLDRHYSGLVNYLARV